MKPVVIWGTGGLSEELYLLINEDKSREVVAFSASREYCHDSTFLGLPLVPDDELNCIFPPSEYDIILSIGFRTMNEFRQQKFSDLKSRGYYIQNYIHKSVILHETSRIGEGNIILQGVLIGIRCSIGNSNIFLMGCNISHDIVIGNFCYFAPGVTLGGLVNSGDRCFFGLNSTVFPRVYVSLATLVGAGAVITTDTDSFDVYAHVKSVKVNQKSIELF